MFSITSSQPVSWPSAPATGVAPVAATAAVTPVQSSGRETQAGLGQGRERQAPDAVRRGSGQPAEARAERAAPDAAPILPRESPDSPDGQPSGELNEAQAKAERQKAEEQAAEKALKQQLQDVLSNVWKASAAVVDVVLGREATAAEATPSAQSDTAPDLSAVAATQLARRAVTLSRPAATAAQVAPWPGDAGDRAAETAAAVPAPVVLVDPRPAQDVVAYDARGNSSWTPLGAGSLVNQRV